MQTHIFSSLRQKSMVFCCFFAVFLLFLPVTCCFLQDFTHFLSFISNILVETIIDDINVRNCGEKNYANPYSISLRWKSMVFCCFLMFFAGFYTFFITYYQNIGRNNYFWPKITFLQGKQWCKPIFSAG